MKMKTLNLKEYNKKYKMNWRLDPKDLTADALVPDKIYKPRIYLDEDCAEIIWLNASKWHKQFLTKKKILRIISLQQRYIMKKLSTREKFVVGDLQNDNYLQTKLNKPYEYFGIVLQYEYVYLLLINSIED